MGRGKLGTAGSKETGRREGSCPAGGGLYNHPGWVPKETVKEKQKMPENESKICRGLKGWPPENKSANTLYASFSKAAGGPENLSPTSRQKAMPIWMIYLYSATPKRGAGREGKGKGRGRNGHRVQKYRVIQGMKNGFWLLAERGHRNDTKTGWLKKKADSTMTNATNLAHPEMAD
jgi:hypothetical protein